MRSLTVLASLALLLALLVGCGGGGTATGAGWIDEADAICRANEVATASLTRRLESLVRTGIRTPRERAAAVALLHRGLPHLAREIAALRRLRPALEDDPSLTALIDGLDGKHAIGERLARAFATGGGPEVERIVRTLAANERRTKRIARGAGLGVCGVNT